MPDTTPTPKPTRPPLREQWADLAARFNAQPARLRWLMLAIGIVVAFIATDEYPWALARSWQAQGDRIERALVRSSGRTALVNPELVRAVAVFGPVEPPGAGDEDRIELGNAINEIFKRHNVTGSSFDSRSGQRMKDPDTARFGGVGLERLQAEVKFEVTADELPKVLAEFEAHPAIESVSTLRLQRPTDPSKRLQVQATIEAWVQATGSTRSRS